MWAYIFKAMISIVPSFREAPNVVAEWFTLLLLIWGDLVFKIYAGRPAILTGVFVFFLSSSRKMPELD